MYKRKLLLLILFVFFLFCLKIIQGNMKQHMLTHKIRDMPQHMFANSTSRSQSSESAQSYGSSYFSSKECNQRSTSTEQITDTMSVEKMPDTDTYGECMPKETNLYKSQSICSDYDRQNEEPDDRYDHISNQNQTDADSVSHIPLPSKFTTNIG